MFVVYDGQMQQVPTPRQRRRKKLNLEMVFRKSIKDNFNEYIKNCSLGGLKQLFQTHMCLSQRFIRFLIMATAFSSVCYYLLYIWSDILNRPLIISMESSNFPISEIAFPAVAMCNVNRISAKALEELVLEEYPDAAKNNRTLRYVKQIMLQWGRLLDYSYIDRYQKDPIFMKQVEKYRLSTWKVISLMKRLSPSCDEMLLRCSWNNQIQDCSQLFDKRRTAHGHCCIFNYALDYGRAGFGMSKTAMKYQTESGSKYGLTLVLDPMIDDYAYPLSYVKGFDIFLFPSTHYADPSTGRVILRKMEPNKVIFFEIKSTKQVATQEVRKYSVKTRNCFFSDENNMTFGFSYSYSTCLLFCRLRTIKSLCKCIPYFYAANNSIVSSGEVCTLDDLQCLNKYKGKLKYLYPYDIEDERGLELELQDSVSCPDCKPDCELTQHSTKAFEIPIASKYSKIHTKDYKGNLIDMNMTNKCVISIYHPTPDATLDLLDVVYYWYEILSNIGGFAGIVIGFSFISIVEIVYFATIRFFQIFYMNLVKYY